MNWYWQILWPKIFQCSSVFLLFCSLCFTLLKCLTGILEFPWERNSWWKRIAIFNAPCAICEAKLHTETRWLHNFHESQSLSSCSDVMNSYYDVEAYFVSRRSFFLMTNCPSLFCCIWNERNKKEYYYYYGWSICVGIRRCPSQISVCLVAGFHRSCQFFLLIAYLGIKALLVSVMIIFLCLWLLVILIYFLCPFFLGTYNSYISNWPGRKNRIIGGGLICLGSTLSFDNLFASVFLLMSISFFVCFPCSWRFMSSSLLFF